MADQPSYDFVYVQTDIPEGMTVREWCAHRAAEQTAERQAARAARRRRSVRRRAWAAGRTWLMALRHRRARIHGARA